MFDKNLFLIDENYKKVRFKILVEFIWIFCRFFGIVICFLLFFENIFFLVNLIGCVKILSLKC